MTDDWIRIRGIRLYGHHGLFDGERARGQMFEIDVALRVDLKPAGASDDMGDTVDYVAVYRIVEQIITGPSVKLLETLGDRIARALLERYTADQVVVRLRKPRVAMPGAVGAVEVEIRRP